ncbi:MAG: RNA polymerase factor sigma-54 [Gammaproteobacteria bacterium]|nr:RNA polymerase factor sigma-54 [Gammaproteobacteria bacterium]
MKPALTLRLGQQLRMTPQLQQAIRLLQLSTFDLQQEIQEALDSNPMLEELNPEDEETGDETTSLDAPDETANASDTSTDTDDKNGDDDSSRDESALPPDPEFDGEAIPDTSEQITSENISDELPVDSVWEDVYEESFLPTSYSSPDENDDNYIDTRNSEAISIQSHLMEQINLLHLTDSDKYIAISIVDGLDSEGVLTIPLEDILEAAPEELELEIDEVLAVLHLIQHLDPVGIAARDLKECLLIQLRNMPDDTSWRDEAILVVDQHIKSLANRDYTHVSRKTRLKESELKEVISLIQSLNPRPGNNIATSNTEYVDPDVIVAKQNERWVVELNPKSAPRIRVNFEYSSLIKRSDDSIDNSYLKNQLQEARWFIKSLQQRNDTLLRVSTKIVEYQRGFLEYGEQAMKPLVLHDIAKAVGLHESTISRVTTQKYMHTPAGVFELKYFFSSHVSTHAGGEVSSTAIRALIKKLVAEENPRKPLSDSKIATMLSDQDIDVARRTIAKYRETLMIPPSNERKQLI